MFMGNTLLASVPAPTAKVLSSESISLENRAQPGSFMAETMRDNILLTTYYMRGNKVTATPDWTEVRKPFEYSFELKPEETYSFQKDSLPEYQNSIVKTISVNFASQDGFKHDGYLMGDGVCHLASLFYKAALKAGVEAKAPTNHNFMPIPEIEREYGVAIYSMPGNAEANAQQNLYVKNNTLEPIIFQINYDGKGLNVEVVKAQNTAQIEPVII